MFKVAKGLLPQSVLETIPENAPGPGSTFETCSPWLSQYNNCIYKNSTFFKGPLFYSELTSKMRKNDMNIENCRTLNSIKRRIKQYLQTEQKLGDPEIWEGRNFLLYQTPGLRKSQRKEQGPVVNYSEPEQI